MSGDYWQDRFNYINDVVSCYQDIISKEIGRADFESKSKWSDSVFALNELDEDFSNYLIESSYSGSVPMLESR